MLLLLGLLCSGLGLARIVKAAGVLSQLSGWQLYLLGILLLGCFLAIVLALARVVATPGPGLRPVDLRVAFALLMGGTILFPVVLSPYSYGWMLIWFGALSALFALWVLFASRWRRYLQTRMGAVLDVTLFNLSLTLVLLHAGLQTASLIFPSSFLSIPGSSRQILEQSRCPPGELRFGFPCNSLGYYDDEPQAVEDFQAAVVGDSFTLGIVPHSMIFTSVAEQLSGLRIDSFGVARAGPPEYRIILAEDALRVDPDIVVAAIFVGNDISHSHLVRARHQGHAWLRSWLDADLNPLWIFAGRLRRLVGELRTGRELKSLGRLQTKGAGDSPGDSPWVTDYRLEKPTYSSATYFDIERSLAVEVCDPGRKDRYSSFFEDLEALVALASPRILAVMLIPDEFQVEDELWQRITADSRLELDRDQPQKIIRPWLDARLIPYLDLLPVFRATPAEPDGNRHLYHFRNTHLNARGDRIAGEELAAFLQRILAD